MLDRTQEQIMQTWKTGDPCMVSVVCATYNHELYIQDAIDGFLMQETDFPFEVVIHDDASTDSTRIIIKEYHLRYPDIIRHIFQKENQYSKGGFKPLVYAAGYSNGNYIALCEGDDYWTDKKKLQLQLREMQKYSECKMSFHPAVELDDNTYWKVISQHRGDNHLFSTPEVILGRGAFCPTASLMFKKELMLNLPDWFYKRAPVGDYFLQILGSADAGALFIDNIMSVYRIGQKGSWTKNQYSSTMTFEDKKGLEAVETYYMRLLETLDEVNIYLENKYCRAIEHAKADLLCRLSIVYLKNKFYGRYKETIKLSCEIYRLNSPKFLVLYYLRIFPGAVNFVRVITIKSMNIVSNLR